MTQMPPGREVLHTTCTLDCPDTCSLAVTVEAGADGSRRIVDIDAAPGNPLTDGWICAKVRQHMRRVYAPERVLTPLVRTGPKGAGEFRPAAWGEAIELIAGRVREELATAGPDSIVAFTYNSSAGATESASTTEALFAALGATVAEHTICAHTMGAAWDRVYGELPSADPLDTVHARLVVVWGANPTVSNTHFPPLVQRAVDAGARLVVVDPRRTAMAGRAHLHLAIRPGTDVVLAHAVAHRWSVTGGIDEAFCDRHAEGWREFLAHSAEWSPERAAGVTGLDPGDIVALADLWSGTRPAMLRIGWGVERNANGGAGCRAVLALPVLGGHFGVPGSGVIGATGTDELRARRRWPDLGSPLPRRSVALHQIGRWLAPGAGDPARVLFVQGANPAVMCPDTGAVVAALSREDVFTVVHEQVLTDTARYADVVLPATTAFEIDDVAASYGSYTVQPVRRVIPPVGESRSNDEVGLALARALGFDWHPGGLEDVTDDPGPRTVTGVPRQFVDAAPFDGAARLVDAEFGVPGYVAPAPSFPLALISPATSRLVNSMFGEFQSPSPAVLLHPVDAAARALVAGRMVRVWNDQGSIVVPLEVHDTTRPGVAVMSKGVWLREHLDGRGVNTLTPSTGDPLVNGACFNDTFVEVGPAEAMTDEPSPGGQISATTRRGGT
jgi:anaerobic selenocysteine-containing dehydrogenase